MKTVVLSSGSKGNTTYIETDEAKILIDAGNSCKYIMKCFDELKVNPEEIDAILITHTHIDHIGGLKTLLKKINPCVYMTEKMKPDLNFINYFTIIDENDFKIKDILVNVIKTSHDTDDSVGYIINNNNNSLVYITDTGYINKRYYNILKNRDIYIFESNHDIEMLNNSSYPFNTRQRILSDKGHLSNYDSAKYLASFLGDRTRYVLLAHLSLENNTSELALSTLRDRFDNEKIDFSNIIIAKQNEKTDVIEI